MFPDQQNQNGGQPLYQPPQYNPGQAPQQAPGGQYTVIPPPVAGNNTGHSGHNPYEFIVNPNNPKHAGHSFGSGSSFLLRIGLLVGGLVVVLLVAGMVLSSLGPKSLTPGLTAIAQRQQEIIRIATAANTQASSQDTQNFAETVTLTIGSSQQQVLKYLTDKGTKLKPKVLALDQNPQTDTLLANAASANTYDSAALQNLTGQLQTYEDLLQTNYTLAKTTQTKQLLQGNFTTADKLLQQAKTLAPHS